MKLIGDDACIVWSPATLHSVTTLQTPVVRILGKRMFETVDERMEHDASGIASGTAAEAFVAGC